MRIYHVFLRRFSTISAGEFIFFTDASTDMRIARICPSDLGIRQAVNKSEKETSTVLQSTISSRSLSTYHQRATWMFISLAKNIDLKSLKCSTFPTIDIKSIYSLFWKLVNVSFIYNQSTTYSRSLRTYHLRATLMGVVRQAVNRSAGSSGFIGSSSSFPQAASWIQSFTEMGCGNDASERLLELLTLFNDALNWD